MNKKSVRAAITILRKNGVITKCGYAEDDFIRLKTTLVINVDTELILTKRENKKIDSCKTDYTNNKE